GPGAGDAIKGRGAGGGGRAVRATAGRVWGPVGRARLSGLPAGTERAGLGRLVPADTLMAETSAARKTATAKVSGRKRTPAPQHSPAAPIVVFDLDTRQHLTIEPSRADEESAPSNGHAADVTEHHERAVDSAGSRGVTPP